MRIALALASLALGLAACGDNLGGGGSGPDAATIDGPTDGPPDAPPDANCPARTVGAVGGPCTTDTQCDTAANARDGICLTAALGGVLWPAEGYCITKYDVCTADADCGSGNVCVSIQDPAGTFRACLPGCGTDPCECSNNQLCGDNLAGSAMNKTACLPGNGAAVDGDGCSGFGDCDESSFCRADSFEHPGGQCMQLGCTIGNDATCTSGGDSHCIDPGFVSAGTGCVDVCAADADCRQSEGYRCFDGGPAAGKYCRHPETGDPCTTDAGCGDPALWDCKTGAAFPGGYCTIQAACNATNGSGCSSGSSVCRDPDLAGPDPAFCIDRCTGIGQGTCRTSYTCTPVPTGGSGCI